MNEEEVVPEEQSEEDAAPEEAEAPAEPEAAEASTQEQPAEAAPEAVQPAEAAAPEAAQAAPDVPEEKRDPLSREPVIDLAKLLKPIEGENPSGEYLRYHGIYDEISEARRADEVLEMGAWQTDLKVADFRLVEQLAVPVLETRTKDLQIAAWLVEALVAEHGFTGMRDGLKLLRSLLNQFWETLFPEIDEGDQEGRANALAWVDREVGFLVRKAPITVDGWGYNGYLDSKKFDIPPNLEGLPTEERARIEALKEQAEREDRATAAKWDAAVAKTDRAFCEEVNVAIIECGDEYKKLNQEIEEKFDRNQAPSLPDMRKALEDIKLEQGRLLEQKRAEEPDPADEFLEEGEGGGESKGGRSGVSGPIANRSDALKRLNEVAAFFRKTEPHSPVSYLIHRAIQWGNMPLESWLQDVIKDVNILNQIKQTLGFNTLAEGSDGGDQPPEAQ